MSREGYCASVTVIQSSRGVGHTSFDRLSEAIEAFEENYNLLGALKERREFIIKRVKENTE